MSTRNAEPSSRLRRTTDHLDATRAPMTGSRLNAAESLIAASKACGVSSVKNIIALRNFSLRIVSSRNRAND